MKRIDVTARGVIADGKTSCSDALSALFAEEHTDVELYFPQGRYYMDKVVNISNAENFSMVGENATVLPAA